MKFRQTETITVAAAKASFSAATGYRIEQDSRLPSAKKEPRERRRPDPLSAVFEQEVAPMLAAAPGLRPIAIFEEIVRRHPPNSRQRSGASLPASRIDACAAPTFQPLLLPSTSLIVSTSNTSGHLSMRQSLKPGGPPRRDTLIQEDSIEFNLGCRAVLYSITDSFLDNSQDLDERFL